MTNSFSIMHYSTVPSRRGFRRVLQGIHQRGAEIIFDLEDSNWIPDDPVATAERKRSARKNLKAFLFESAREGEIPFGVRVNRAGSAEFLLDLALLTQLGPRHRPTTVVVPKVETRSDLLSVDTALKERGVIVDQLVPILETRGALDDPEGTLADLATIADRLPGWRITFGLFDYCLDLGVWPFWAQDGPELWRFLAGFIPAVERQGFEYIHPPHERLRHSANFKFVLEQLGRLCRRRFYLTTVTADQLRAYAAAGKGTRPAPEAGCHPEQDPVAYAREISACYESGRTDAYGFVLDPGMDRFIPPHVYIGAKRYLEGGRAQVVKRFTLGIVGGCMAYQAGVNYSRLYHRVLARMLAEGPGVRLRVRIARGINAPHRPRILRLLQAHALDLLLLQIRPGPAVAQAKLLVRAFPGASTHLNRCWGGRQAAGPIPGSEGPEGSPAENLDGIGRYAQEAGRRHFLARAGSNLHLAVGLLAGTRAGMHARVTGEIALAVNTAAEHGVETLVVGPSPYAGTRLAGRVLEALNRVLAGHAAAAGILYVNLFAGWDRDPGNILLPDGIHLSAAGHTHVAERIYEVLSMRFKELGSDSI